MSDPEQPRENDGSPSAGGLTPEPQSAVEQVLAMFPAARSDPDVTGQINALGQLMDPEVRHRLMAAVEQMRAAGLDAVETPGSGPAILDLRGTPAGEALRASVMRFGAGHGLSPAQIIFDESVPVAEPNSAPVDEAPAPPAPVTSPEAEASPIPARETRRQPSLVEDAGSGGVLGWLSRLLNGREA